MRKAEIAQRFLSFLIDPDKSATIVGDLVETSSLSIHTVIRIAGAEMLAQLTTQAARIAIMATQLFVAQFIFFLPISLFSYVSFLLRLPDSSVVFGAIAGTYFLAQIAVGVQLVRMAKTQAVVVCLMLGAMNVAAGLMGIDNVSIGMALWHIPIAIGTVCQRWQDARHA